MAVVVLDNAHKVKERQSQVASILSLLLVQLKDNVKIGNHDGECNGKVTKYTGPRQIASGGTSSKRQLTPKSSVRHMPEANTKC